MGNLKVFRLAIPLTRGANDKYHANYGNDHNTIFDVWGMTRREVLIKLRERLDDDSDWTEVQKIEWDKENAPKSRIVYRR